MLVKLKTLCFPKQCPLNSHAYDHPHGGILYADYQLFAPLSGFKKTTLLKENKLKVFFFPFICLKKKKITEFITIN